MGQSGMRAALIYQHATSERDREIANDMDKHIARTTNPKKPARKKPADEASGTPGARKINHAGTQPPRTVGVWGLGPQAACRNAQVNAPR